METIFGWNMLPTSFSFPRRQTHNVHFWRETMLCDFGICFFWEPDQTCPGFRMLRFMLMSQEVAPKLGMRWWRILHHGTPWNPWHSQTCLSVTFWNVQRVKCNDINPCCPWAIILLAKDASLVDERLTPLRVILRSNLDPFPVRVHLKLSAPGPKFKIFTIWISARSPQREDLQTCLDLSNSKQATHVGWSKNGGIPW